MIGDKISHLRKMRKLTIQEMSDKIGISIASLSMYENGKRIPSIHNLKKIAEFLNVEFSELYKYDMENFDKIDYQISEQSNSIANKRANGFCELCKKPAPFITNEGKPYLITSEITYPDNTERKNIFALCPNCTAKIEQLNLIGDRIFLFNSIER